MQVFVLIRPNEEPLVFQDQGKATREYKDLNTPETPVLFYAVDMEIVL